MTCKCGEYYSKDDIEDHIKDAIEAEKQRVLAEQEEKRKWLLTCKDLAGNCLNPDQNQPEQPPRQAVVDPPQIEANFDEVRLEAIDDDPIPMRPLRLRRQISDPLDLDDDDFHRANRDFLMRDADEILFGRRPAPNVQLD